MKRANRLRQAFGSLTVGTLLLGTAAAVAASAQPNVATLVDGTAGTIFYLGALATVVVFNLLHFITGRDECYLEYALFTLGIAAGEIGMQGIGGPLFGPEGAWPNALQPLGFALAGVCAALFTRQLLQTAVRVPRLDILLRAMAGGFGVAVLGSLMAPALTNSFLALAGPLFCALAIVCGLRYRKLKAPGARLHLAGWCALLAGVLTLVGTRLGLIGDNILSRNAMELGSALGILMLSLALAERAGARWREQAFDQNEALANAQMQIETLTASENALTQSLKQRTKEVDDLTARLNEGEHRFQQMSHLDPLTGMANQLLLNDRIEQGIIRSKRHNTRTAVIALDVNGFGRLLETHGKDTTDAMLCMIAMRLRGIVREQDTVARPESDEFVIVLEEVFDGEDLQRVVAALKEEFAQPFRIGDKILEVSVSLGSAIYPEGGMDAPSLLKNAAKLMRRTKEGQRLNHRESGGDRGHIPA